MPVKPKKLQSESENDHQRSRATKAVKKSQESKEEKKSESDWGASEVCICIYNHFNFSYKFLIFCIQDTIDDDPLTDNKDIVNKPTKPTEIGVNEVVIEKEKPTEISDNEVVIDKEKPTEIGGNEVIAIVKSITEIDINETAINEIDVNKKKESDPLDRPQQISDSESEKSDQSVLTKNLYIFLMTYTNLKYLF